MLVHGLIHLHLKQVHRLLAVKQLWAGLRLVGQQHHRIRGPSP